MDNNKEIFRFDLEESLYFEKGQEVGEITGISLDPDISIQPFHEYISIRGVIELRGSYRKEPVSQEEDEGIVDIDDYQSRRYVEKVVELDHDQAEFTHRFPVEISVPAYRVADMEDVTVSIESFDYEVPNQHQLKLSSTVEIHGISDENANTSGGDEESAESVFPHRDEETFAFDIKMDEEKLEADENEYPEQPPVLPQAGEQDTGQVTEQDTSSEKDRWKGKKSQTLAEFFGKDQPESTEHEASMPEGEPLESSAESSTLVEFTETAYQNENDESSASPEDVRYLADMFSREEEETYAKMRLCIVQGNDTVESIAERYKISALQLLKQNRLTEDGLEEGQLLYIPYKKNS
ncbi:stage VI sporulation protein D [Lentibacillus halodurans]|uniref:Stage VI sporulation protein D n=1 Tax=Lentibacillus halodurans TaxID=237679 RepID=A0A1I0UXL8_9BACI|nr:stage VI sporulation protein D [Lentibacillus halodurans]SFA68844.1 stage VI sporulation protein D [Lentibacillus halodurans]